MALKRPRLPHGSRAMRITNAWFEDYCIRAGGDGKIGIYLRDYNVRLATFNANTNALQMRLAKLFESAISPPDPKRRKPRSRPVRDDVGGGAFMSDVGEQKGWK
jgi:hypothetical protein